MHRDEVTGRFRRDVGTHELLDRLAQLQRHHGLAYVSVRRFNALRDGVGLPSAQALCARLGVGWPVVLRLAAADRRARAEVLGHARADSHREACGDEVLLRALRAAALRVGGYLSSDAYDLTAPGLCRAYARAGGHLVLPHSALLMRRFGSWAGVVQWAGLPGRPEPATPKARPAVELLDEFVDAYGLVPPSTYFRQWCQVHGVLLGRDARRWREVVAAVREERIARGAAMPVRLATASELPPFPEVVTPVRPGRRVAPGARGYTREQALDALRHFGAVHLRTGREPRWRDYRAVSAR